MMEFILFALMEQQEIRFTVLPLMLAKLVQLVLHVVAVQLLLQHAAKLTTVLLVQHLQVTLVLLVLLEDINQVKLIQVNV